MAKTILVVDDEGGIRASLQGILEDEGYKPLLAEDGETALDMVQSEVPDLVLLDIWMPGIDGIDVLQKLKTAYPSLLIIMMSGHGTIETAVRATKMGAYDFIEKPLSLEKLILTIQNAFEMQRLQDENRVLRGDVLQDHELIGESPAVSGLRQQIQQIAPSSASVLITGENGTGKGIVALAVHAQSSRSNRPFLEVNCASIPDQLIDSELFGHEKGAFPGATSPRKGKFELADGGTVFLDEIDDMSPRTQAKVLRVLQEGKFERVGGTRTIEVDVRIVAAANRVLDAEIRQGAFREDLYYRLNVVSFAVLPLRERKEDIPLLLAHFLLRYSRKEGREQVTILPEAVALLKCYDWPGNVRELKNIMERLVIMSSGRAITVDHLPDYIRNLDLFPESSTAANSLREAREGFEKDFITQKLEEFDWDISKTADAIELERTNLHRKIKSYGIDLKK
jgi:two-component system nitrogen regulation response regulator NtrX